MRQREKRERERLKKTLEKKRLVSGDENGQTFRGDGGGGGAAAAVTGVRHHILTNI